MTVLSDLVEPTMEEVLERLYWIDGMTMREIADKLHASSSDLPKAFRHFGIPARPVGTGGWYSGGRTICKEANGQYYWIITNRGSGNKVREHVDIIEQAIGRRLSDEEPVHHKDGNSLNNHYLNLQIMSPHEHGVAQSRTSLYAVYMGLTQLLSTRSSCRRAKTGTVITSHDLQTVYSVGYNGNASGMVNDCDSDKEGECGCIHSEENAIIKVHTKDPQKVLFTTTSPCLKCAKLIINSGFSWVFYGEPYRKVGPLSYLHYAGVKTCPYPIYLLPSSNSIVVRCHPVSGDTLCPCGCGRPLKDTEFGVSEERITPEFISKTYGKIQTI